MTAYKSELLTLLFSRGYIHQVTDAAALDGLAAKAVIPAYIGFDPTAPSLHVGSLVQIMMLRRLQQAGHKPIVLMGGGTGKIGDPSFKDEARKLMTEEVIAANIASIKTVFERFLTFGDGPTGAILLDNAEWLDRLNYLRFLREVGQHFSVNRMLSFDSVKLRLDREQSLSFLEFNYMITQAYDFLELGRRLGCRLQLGGSDQWGNIVGGVELNRRADGREVYGLTTPLITLADGGKMGKTEKGAIWLNADQLGPYDYWQFWRNTQDADVGRFLRLFTDLPLAEIGRLEALAGAEINDAKKVLADAATEMLHGAHAAGDAGLAAAGVFEQFAIGDAASSEIVKSGGSLPTIRVPGDGIGLADALVQLGLTSSKKEARRLISQGGARVDGDVVTDEQAILKVADTVRVSAGRKKHGLLTS